MARTPKNQVKANLYTQGGEFVIKSSGVDYIGPYYLINNKAYAGKDPFTSQTTTIKETPFSIPTIIKVEPIELDVNPNLLPPGADTNLLASIGNAVGFFTQAYNFAKSNIAVANDIKDKIFPSKSIKSSVARTGFHYFIQQINDPSKIIKEVDINTFNNLQKDPIYRRVSIDFSAENTEQQIEDGEKQIPGLKTFLEL